MKQFLKFFGSVLIAFATTALYAQEEQPMIGQRAPSFELKGIDDKNYSLAQWKGQLLMIHFATT